MNDYKVTPIGTIHVNEEGCHIQLQPEFIPGLKALEGFSHLNLLWWLHEQDDPECRQILTTPKPYKKAPDEMGIFATRSPVRPNPVALSVAQVIWMDAEQGLIGLAWIDAHDGTPLLDIKPYTPSMDRVEAPKVPDWCAHWPESLEASGAFDWEHEFLF